MKTWFPNNASVEQIARLQVLSAKKLHGPVLDVYTAHLRTDPISHEQADHEIADLSALPNRRG